MRSAIVLTKINGIFDAAWSYGRPGHYVPARRAGMLNTSLFMLVVMLVPLLLLGALAFIVSHLGFQLGAGGSIHHVASAKMSALAGLGVMGTTVESMISDLNKAFNTFKESNDERIKKIENGKSPDTLLVEKVENSNKAISEMEKTLKEMQAKIRDQETAAARFVENGSPEAKALEVKNAKTFFALTRGQEIENVSNDDLDAYRAYRKAYNTYLRKGAQALGDTNIRNALATGAASTGGYWVTPDQSGRLVELIYQTSPMRQLASVQSIGTDTLEGWNDLSEGDSGWVGETEARPETNTPVPNGKWAIPVFEQYTNPKITQKMLDDSFFDVEGWLMRKNADKMTRVENTAFVTGNGTNKPRGWLDYFINGNPITGKQTATTWKVLSYMKTGTNNDWPAQNPADKIIDLITMLKPELRNGASFVGNTLTLSGIRKLKDGQGNYLFLPSFVNGVATPPAVSALSSNGAATQGNLSPAGTLMGFNYYELADMPDYNAGTPFALAFGNWREAYQIVDHTVGVRVLRDPYTGKPYISFYTTKRVGADVLNFEAIKGLKFSA